MNNMSIWVCFSSYSPTKFGTLALHFHICIFLFYTINKVLTNNIIILKETNNIITFFFIIIVIILISNNAKNEKNSLYNELPLYMEFFLYLTIYDTKQKKKKKFYSG